MELIAESNRFRYYRGKNKKISAESESLQFNETVPADLMVTLLRRFSSVSLVSDLRYSTKKNDFVWFADSGLLYRFNDTNNRSSRLNLDTYFGRRIAKQLILRG